MRYLILFFTLVSLSADPLPSWNEGEAKKSILAYIEEVSHVGGANYTPIKERVAVFDEDGTLWVEQPLYVQYFFAVDQVQSKWPQHPEWRDQEPFKSILDNDLSREQNFSEKEIAQIIEATHSGMTVEDFQEEVRKWLKQTVHPRFKRPFTELVYQPMLELLHHLKLHQFRIYIVSGGGQDFMRVYAEEVYKIPVENVVGTIAKVKYEMKDGIPHLFKLSDLLLLNNFAGKVEGIGLMIGKKPTIAFGNSIGDQQMLEWTQSHERKTLEALVHHDDDKREYAYGPNSKIGTFSDALMSEAKNQNWIIISMKDDWNMIFPPPKPIEDNG